MTTATWDMTGNGDGVQFSEILGLLAKVDPMSFIDSLVVVVTDKAFEALAQDYAALQSFTRVPCPTCGTPCLPNDSPTKLEDAEFAYTSKLTGAQGMMRIVARGAIS